MGQVWRASNTRGRRSEHIDAFGDERHSEHQKQYRLQAGKAGATVGWGCLSLHSCLNRCAANIKPMLMPHNMDSRKQGCLCQVRNESRYSDGDDLVASHSICDVVGRGDDSAAALSLLPEAPSVSSTAAGGAAAVAVAAAVAAPVVAALPLGDCDAWASVAILKATLAATCTHTFPTTTATSTTLKLHTQRLCWLTSSKQTVCLVLVCATWLQLLTRFALISTCILGRN